MFGGGDSSSTQQQQNKPTKNYQTTTQQWSLNPSAYQNVANDQVDWAALAQQWIQMKESYPPDLLSNAPPPPSFFSKDVSDYDEKGEAPMEVEKDDEHQTEATTSSSTNSSTTTSASQLLLNGTATAWTAPSTNSSSTWNASFTSSSAAAQWRWSGWTDPTGTASSNQTETPRITILPTATVYSIVPTAAAPTSSDHWSSSSKSRYSSSDHHHHHHSSRNRDDSFKSDNDDHDDDDLMQTLDAAKRKALPAWIREGLEKMEREKLKQEEKERERREREAILLERRKAEEEALKELEKESLIPKKSKFDSDSEDEYEATSSSTNIQPYIRVNSTSTEQAEIEASAPIGKIKYNDYSQRSKSPELNYKTRDDLIQELMLAVRKNLTEILLEVTNEEILAIALETCTKARKKAPTAQTMRKTTLTASLSGGLGLGIYDDSSDSGSDSEEDKDAGTDPNDSDIELQETIKRRKLSFEKIARDIEAQIAEQDEREERSREREALNKSMEDEKLNRTAVGDGLSSTDVPSPDSVNDGKHNFFYDKKDGEPQLHDKNILKYGRSRREKKPSRFSDPKDIVKNVQTHIQIVASQQKLDSQKDEVDGTKMLSNDKGYRQLNDSNSSSSEESSAHHKDLIKKLVRNYSKSTTKYNDNSDESVSSDEIKSHRSSSRRSDRSEESRSSYRRERSRSRSRDYYKSSSRDYRSHDYYRRSRDSRDRDYDRRTRDRSRSHSYDSKRRYRSHDERSKSRDRVSSRSGDTKSSSRHKY